MNIDSLNPLSAAKEKLLGKLTLKKHRQREGLFLAEGVRLVEEALDAGVRVSWAVASEEVSGERAAALIAALGDRGVAVYRAAERTFRARLDVVTPQAVAAVCELPGVSLERISFPRHCLAVVCDSVRDPGNLGAILRVAAAVGVEAVLLGPGTVDPYNPKCVRGSMGALFRLPAIPFDSAEVLGDFIGKAGFTVYEASSEGENVFSISAFPPRTALIMGSEARGVSSVFRRAAPQKLSVPMARTVESLNVAVAAGVLLYEISRKLG